jgi:rod shape-determining protein MreB
MFNFLRPYFSGGDMAVDLGASRTRVYARGKGIVLDEPSAVAIGYKDGPTGKPVILAVGAEARMLERAPGNIQLVWPMGAMIYDHPLFGQMLERLIRKAYPRRRLAPSPRVIVSVPDRFAQGDDDAVREVALRAGVSKVCLIRYPMAAAMGAGLPVSGPGGCMVMDIGWDITEIAVIARGGMACKASLKICGDDFNNAISHYFRHNHQMLLKDREVEHIKKEIGSAFPDAENRDIEVWGIDLDKGYPRRFTVSSNEVRVSFADTLPRLASAIMAALEQTPPELGADIAGKGIMLTGGGALLRGLDRYLQEETGVPVTVAQDPANCTIRGCGQVLEHLDEWLRDENCQWLT